MFNSPKNLQVLKRLLRMAVARKGRLSHGNDYYGYNNNGDEASNFLSQGDIFLAITAKLGLYKKV
jgi:hypothetical protein